MNKAGWIVAVVIAAGAGFLVRGLMPSGKGGAGAGAPASTMPTPVVKVTEARMESTSPVVEYIARVEPIQQVLLTAQVEGIIEEVHFREGTQVKQGDLLFTIDSRPYEASLAQRKAELEQAQASLGRAERYLAMLTAADNRSVSKSDMDAAEANVSEGRALVQRATAAVRQAEIDLGYTRITSPIDGRIGRALITRGNLVSPSTGTLATVIQIDPVRVVFAMPDKEYLTAFDRYSTDEAYNPDVRVRLANGVVYPETGTIDFDDNQMNPATGTMAIRMRFDNPRRLLVANNFVTVLVRDGNAPQKVVVPVDSVMYGSDGAYVWSLLEDSSVAMKPIKPGAVIGTLQIVEGGLDAGEKVVTAGVQSLRPGVTVAVKDSSPAE